MNLDHIKAQCADLTHEQRADLAYFLLHTLADADQERLEQAWRTEVRRRMAEIRAGKVVGKPAEQVFAEVARNNSEEV
jgi:putative addiction module component (TIGR02574 family)